MHGQITQAILMLANAMSPHPKVLLTCAVAILALDPIGISEARGREHGWRARELVSQ